MLVSMVERVDTIDPLQALEMAARGAEADLAMEELTATRMYWTRPADDFALAGIGAAVTFAPEGADRFATIDREWISLIDDALIQNSAGDMAGAGPTLMGGFAFDPEGPRTELWRDFPAAQLVLPRLHLARTRDECLLTTTVLVGIDGRLDIQPAMIARLRAAFLGDVARVPGPGVALSTNAPLTYTDVRDAIDWRATVCDAVSTIRTGKLEKVVLAREVRTRAPHDFDVTAALRQLRAAHPSCYVFGCWHRDSVFLGATPERLVRVDGRCVRASSLAGSVRRGATPDDDAAQAAELFASTKDRAEHEIVRRALCEGLQRLCDDVTAADEPALLSLPHVHHLHTAVHARLRTGHTLLQLVAQLHPTPAVGGAPRNAALRFIREHEHLDRGWYAAPVGWLQRDRGEFAVALRSALITGPEASLFAGCGVVADSDPDGEYAESLLKLQPMEAALVAALATAEVLPVVDAIEIDNDATGMAEPVASGGRMR